MYEFALKGPDSSPEAKDSIKSSESSSNTAATGVETKLGSVGEKHICPSR